ncbi:hypothetical protein Tco_1453313 [Tanacetum coccineum]
MKMTTIRLVKTVFLHGDLDEDIYMTQPEGFQSSGKEENLMCKLTALCRGQGSDVTKIKKLKRKLSQKFKMKDLEKFNMKDAEARCQPLGDHYKLSKKQAPKTEASRPDIAHVVRVVSRFMSIPGREHWEAIKWLLRYLKGTSMATLCFSIKDVVLEGFSYSDYRGCLDSGKSTTGYVFTLGGTAVSWMSRIQKCIAMSTIEAEYIAIAEAGKELVWLKNFLKELDIAQTECVLFCDKQSAIHLVKNLVFHAKNLVDMLTKVVTTEKLKLCAASTDSKITDEWRLRVSYVWWYMKVRAVAYNNVVREELRAEGPRLRAEGSDVNLTKRTRGRTPYLTQISLRSYSNRVAKIDIGSENRLRAEAPTGGQRLPPYWAKTPRRWARPICSLPRL